MKTVKASIVDTYETKTKMERGKLAKMMTDETWMTAREAKDYGFIDELVTGSVKKADFAHVPAGFSNCLSNYMHVPEALMRLISEPVQSNGAQNTTPPTGGEEPSEEERRLRNEIQLLKGAKNESQIVL